MEYWCRACKQAFESDEPRCPACLKRSSVVSQGQSKSASGAAGSMNLFRGPGLLVTLLILVPLMTLNTMQWRLGWWFTFVAAMVGFGAGHGVNWWWHKRKGA